MRVSFMEGWPGFGFAGPYRNPTWACSLGVVRSGRVASLANPDPANPNPGQAPDWAILRLYTQSHQAGNH